MNQYKAPFFYKNGHLNTILTALYRKEPEVSYVRERLSTSDGDFLDLDFLKGGHSRAAIICHGLEGSSGSKYVKGTSDILTQNGYDICAMNYRFCSGEINNTPQMYHSGWTPDLDEVVIHVSKYYDQIALVGYSLGGNLVLKYVGERGGKVSNKIKAVCAVSVPVNLLSSSLVMERWENRLYTWRFLKTLKEKIKLKHQQFPEYFDLSHLRKVKTVKDFDDYYTGPLNGYEDAKDYYKKCSADQFLPHISVPTLLINAMDDPFLGMRCYPGEKIIGNDKLTCLYPEDGGHVGFYRKELHTWNEERVADFLCK